MLDKEHRIQQIANRYTPPLDLNDVRERFTTRPGNLACSGARRITGQHEQRVINPPKPAMSRKHRLRLRRAAKGA